MAAAPENEKPKPTDKSAAQARERSPNYPSIGIKDALELARKLWDREKRTIVAPETAVKAWGYSGLSGASRSALAAVRQYGLVEDVKDGGVKLSDLAMEALHQPDGSSAKADAVAKAAVTPPIFKQLAASHAEGSDDALKSYLMIKRGFTEDGAKRLIRAFREALSLGGPAASGVGGAGGGGESNSEVLASPPDGGGIRLQTGRPKVIVFSWPLSKTLAVEVRFTGDDVQPAHVDRLKQYLELVKDAVGGDSEE